MERAAELYRAAKALLTYIDEAYVFDKMADAGCGGVDPYRSEQFDALIKHAQRAVAEFEGECKQTSGPGSDNARF